MNKSVPLDSPATRPKKGKRTSSLKRAGDSFSAKADDRHKAGGDTSVATANEVISTLGPASDRVISGGGALVKDTAAAKREETSEAKPMTDRAIESAESYVSQRPKRSVVIAAAVGAAAAALVLTKR